MWANPAHALDGGIPVLFDAERPCPAASDVRRWSHTRGARVKSTKAHRTLNTTSRSAQLNRWAKQFMRWHLLVLIAVFGFANHCRCQEKGLTSHSVPGTNSLSSLEASVVGTWRLDFPEAEQDGTNVFLRIQLSANRKWHWFVSSDNPRTDPNQRSGAWFVHGPVLVLRLNDSTITNGIFNKMAYVFDIQSVSRQSLRLTNSPFGDVTWRRIAQDGAADVSQPFLSDTNRASAAAGSHR
jgi:hypothetical protein